jgi:cell division protein FtsQ
LKRPPSRVSGTSRPTAKPVVESKPAKKPAKAQKPKLVLSKKRPAGKAQKRVDAPLQRSAVRVEARRTASVAKAARVKSRELRSQRLAASGVTPIKRAWAWAAVGSMFTLIALVLAAVFSPMLAIERLSVRGEKLVSEKEIKAALKSQLGKPLPQVNEAEIADALKKFPLIESFSLISAPPRTLVVKITERTPIAIVWVEGFGYSYFDPAGVRVGRAENRQNLPTLEVSGTPGKSPSFRAAIDVLLAVPIDLLPRISTVSAKSKDDVSFKLRGYAGQRIIWGDSSQAVLKSKVLTALIKNQSKNDRVTYDVSSPEAPVVRY